MDPKKINIDVCVMMSTNKIKIRLYIILIQIHYIYHVYTLENNNYINLII